MNAPRMQPTLKVARLSTRNFTFEGAGWGTDQAVEALRYAVDLHCTQRPWADRDYFAGLLADPDNLEWAEYTAGEGYVR